MKPQLTDVVMLKSPGQTTRHLAEDHRGRDENSWKDVERAAVAGPGPV